MMKEIFSADLLKDENIQWTGQPETSVLFSPADILAIPFSLLWGGFAIFWEYNVVSLTLKSRNVGTHAIPIGMALFGIPFVVIGLYMIFGRFFMRGYLKRRTYYAVTDKRILIVTGGLRRNVQAEFIDKLTGMNKSVRSDGIGTIVFGPNANPLQIGGNTGMVFGGMSRGVGTMSFSDIQGADRVYETINRIRDGEKSF